MAGLHPRLHPAVERGGPDSIAIRTWSNQLLILLLLASTSCEPCVSGRRWFVLDLGRGSRSSRARDRLRDRARPRPIDDATSKTRALFVSPVVLTAIIVPELVLPRGELDGSLWATGDGWPV